MTMLREDGECYQAVEKRLPIAIAPALVYDADRDALCDGRQFRG
jgi:hypothetical protein